MYGQSIRMARQGAIFINEVFRKLPECELFIYGHTADQTSQNETGIMIYREPGFQTDPHALGSVRARGNNRDGHAILAVAKRMRKLTKNEGILFVLSDGQPAASEYHNGVKDTREKVTKAQGLGFQVIQIAIDKHIPSAEMFDYFIEMTDIKNLPRDLVSYMSRKVDKMIKSTISM